MDSRSRVLLIFSVTNLGDMLAKGNIAYMSYYTSYFDECICLYLLGEQRKKIKFGSVTLTSPGLGISWLDFLLSPFTVFRVARSSKATHFLSADLAYAWWHFSLLALAGRKLVVMPVCTPSEIWHISGRTYSGLPYWLEKAFVHLTLACAEVVLSPKNSSLLQRWISSSRWKKKLRIVPVLPEEFPAPAFFNAIEAYAKRDTNSDQTRKLATRLIYVGRLEPEKLTEDLILVADLLSKAGHDFTLTIVGDGTERQKLEKQTLERGLEQKIEFLGFLPSGSVGEQLLKHGIFVSPLTGTSLREALLAGLAVVAYRLDFVADLLENDRNCLFAEPRDVDGMARQIGRLIKDGVLYKNIAKNGHELALSIWSKKNIVESLRLAFEEQ
jgi:glycosyltransferase involved in cell wall biosynthesis